MTDIIKCKDCKYLEKWRTPERSAQFDYLVGNMLYMNQQQKEKYMMVIMIH